jgi:MFS transporter, DHA1 family, 2-module integral membrane pump EmrD
MQKKHLIYISVLFLVTIAQISLNIVVPILPVLVDKFHTSVGAMQSSISIYILSFGLSSLFYGPFSDFLGRKPIILFGISIHLVGTIIAAISFNLSFFLLGRMLQGIGAGATALTSRTIIRDYFEGKAMHQAVTTLVMVMAISPAVAPTIGGLIYTWIDWRAIFGFVGIYIILILLFTNAFLPETNKEVKTSPLSWKKIISFYIFLLRHKVYIVYVTAIILSYSCQVVYLTVSPFVFQQHLKLSPEQYGNLIFLPAVGYFIGGFCIKFFHRIISTERIIKIGAIILILSGFFWTLSYLLGYFTVISTISPMIIGITGVAMIFTAATSGFLEPFPQNAGTATALAAFFQMVGSSSVNFIINFFQFTTPLIIAFIFIIFGIGLLFLFKRPNLKEKLKT